MDQLETPKPSLPVKPLSPEAAKPVYPPASACMIDYLSCIQKNELYGHPIPEGRLSLLLNSPSSPVRDTLINRLKAQGLLTAQQEGRFKKDGKVLAYLTYLQERLEELQVEPPYFPLTDHDRGVLTDYLSPKELRKALRKFHTMGDFLRETGKIFGADFAWVQQIEREVKKRELFLKRLTFLGLAIPVALAWLYAANKQDAFALPPADNKNPAITQPASGIIDSGLNSQVEPTAVITPMPTVPVATVPVLQKEMPKPTLAPSPLYLEKLPDGTIYFSKRVDLITEYVGDYITPTMIIVHWDGNESPDKTQWLSTTTRNGLVGGWRDSATFAVGVDGVLQLVKMTETQVQSTTSATGRDPYAINIEMSGAWFDENHPPEAEVEAAVDLIVRLMLQYHLSLGQVRGHFEEDTTKEVAPYQYVAVPADDPEAYDWGKSDPGENFLQLLKERIKKRLKELKKASVTGNPERALAAIQVQQVREARLRQMASDRRLHNLAAAKAQTNRSRFRRM